MDIDPNRARPFVVTGCGRSGTKYMAQLLTAAGVPCTHERLFTGRMGDRIGHALVIADSSWLAAPFLNKLPTDTLVLHQTRNPLAVVASHVARGFFDPYSHERPVWKHVVKRILRRPPSGQYRLILLVRNVLPNVFAQRTAVQRAARFWIDWNSLVETSSESRGLERLTYRIEDLDSSLLASLVERITGQVLTSKAAQSALETVPTNVNTGPSRAIVSLDDLGPLRDQFVAKASSYGYDVEQSVYQIDKADSTDLTVLFVAAMGGLGGPVKRLATLLMNVVGIRRILIKPRSDLLDSHMVELGSIEEHIQVRRSAQRSYVGSFVLMVKIFKRVASRKQPVDVIHANGIVEFALCWPAAFLFRKPMVAWVGNYESPVLVKRFSLLFRTVSRRTRWNAVSMTAADVIVDCGLAERDAVQIVTNIVDPADIAPTARPPVPNEAKRLRIGYLQVAQWVKGFDLLPKVIAELRDIHHLVEFLIFTKRNDNPAWVDFSALPSEVVKMRPRTANVGNIYAECDIVFSPSRRESFSRVAAESLASGTPLVATDLEPVRRVVGEAALLFPVDDVTAAADCLRRLVHDADLRARLSRAGRFRSQAWLPRPVAEQFVAQYRRLANSGATRM